MTRRVEAPDAPAERRGREKRRGRFPALKKRKSGLAIGFEVSGLI